MNIRIYQINKDRDTYEAKFMPYDESRPVEASSYDKVFEGDVDCEDLEDVFALFNTDGHPLHRGHDLSMSDIVETVDDGTFHYCDRFGFKQVDFDPTQAHTADGLLNVVVVDSEDSDYRSLTDEECDRYMECYAEPEEISQEEIDEHTGFTILPADSFNPFEPF